jgi:hypothetical protein
MLAAAAAAELEITVYDQAHLSREIRQTALDTVREIFRASAIDTVFVAGDPMAAEASLITMPLTLKGQERVAQCRARRDIALEIIASVPTSLKSTILGTAVPLAREGLNVRVFDDHIRDAAFKWNRSYAVLLAHAIAHEIGHVLLRSGEHSSKGLMSGSWGDYEYDWISRGIMLFSKAQSHRMLMTLDGTGCSCEGQPPLSR